MGEHGKKARDLFTGGLNCAQSVFGAYSEELGLEFDTAMRLSAGLGGGIGRLRETCGAVLGMTMALSLARADTLSKEALYTRVQVLVNRFRAEQGSILCRDLLGETGKDCAPQPSARTAAYYADRPCARLVEYAAELLEEELKGD